MIIEAKAGDDFTAFGTFRPLGTSAPFWRAMSDRPTVYVELPAEDFSGMVEIFDNADMLGTPVATVPAGVVRG